LNNNEFRQAPVSEVILGVTFKKKVLQLEDVFTFTQIFKNAYPILELKNPLANQKLEAYKHITEIENDKVGPFRVFQRTRDAKFLIQYQSNKILFNWIRRDDKDVGEYPGFKSIKEKFDNVLKEYTSTTKDDLLTVDYYDLTYQDRIKWQDYISNLSDIDQLFNISLPIMNIDVVNNLVSELTYKLPELNGYGLLELRTGMTIDEKQILRFQYTLRGHEDLKNLDHWFEKAHKKQLAIFKDFFKPELLEKWK